MAERKHGLYANCSCSAIYGPYSDKSELLQKIFKMKKCQTCNNEFGYIGAEKETWNFKIIVEPSVEEYVVELLNEISKIPKQFIFGYEDLGPDCSKEYRYPDKKFNFHYHERTERASPAIAINIFQKGKPEIERSYCFADPYSLLQIAREVLKGYNLLKYGKI